MKDWTIIASIFSPEAKNSKNAKIIDIIMETLIFLYCFALMVLSIISFVLFNLSLTLNSPSKIRHSILDCRTLSKIIAPKIMNRKMELKRMVCSHPSL